MTRHECSRQFPGAGYGDAITECSENEHGEFWAGNDEYGTQVAFCPFCGAKAPSQPIDLALVEYTRAIPGNTLRAHYTPTGDTVEVPVGAEFAAEIHAKIAACKELPGVVREA